MNASNDSGVTHFQRLDPNKIDVVLGSARTSRAAPPTRGGRSFTGLLALLAIAVAAWGWYSRTPNDAAPPAGPGPQASMDQPVREAAPTVNASLSSQVVNQATVVIINPPARATAARAAPAEPAVAPNQPQGLVSAQYLAQFRAASTHPSTSAAKAVQIATVTMREWDGPNRYVARWRIQDNVIDQDSVCFNFPDDSIEHRECRRAAQQYFRNQCKDWTRRSEKARDRETRDARIQLCGVAQSFVP